MAKRECYICDRCRAQYFDQNFRLEVVYKKPLGKEMLCNSEVQLEKYDLCPDCQNKLLDFLREDTYCFNLQGDRYDRGEDIEDGSCQI